MTRYFGDGNLVGFYYESGTYANTSGALQWIGQVKNHDITENTNVQTTRYLGTDDRSVSALTPTVKDVEGAFTYYPQDWKFLMFGLGGNIDGGSPDPYTHTMTEKNSDDGNSYTSGTLNPFISFSLADSKKGKTGNQYFVRTVNGAMVNTWSMSWSQGDIIECETNYRAQSVTFTSGTLPALSETTNRPYLGKDVQVSIPSGTDLLTNKGGTFTVNNNVEGPHYNNGSEVIGVPYPVDRDYELSLTVDWNWDMADTYYQSYYKGGSSFNAQLSVSASAGSREVIVTMSGCKLTDMPIPSPSEGVNEATLTIVPSNVSAVASDSIEKYAPW